MEKFISQLFSTYLSEQTVAADEEYQSHAKKALELEKELRERLGADQTKIFEELFEETSQIHFLEVKDAFYSACKLGAKARDELTI